MLRLPCLSYPVCPTLSVLSCLSPALEHRGTCCGRPVSPTLSALPCRPRLRAWIARRPGISRHTNTNAPIRPLFPHFTHIACISPPPAAPRSDPFLGPSVPCGRRFVAKPLLRLGRCRQNPNAISDPNPKPICNPNPNPIPNPNPNPNQGRCRQTLFRRHSRGSTSGAPSARLEMRLVVLRHLTSRHANPLISPGAPLARLEILFTALDRLTSRHPNPSCPYFRCTFGPPGNATRSAAGPHIQAHQPLPATIASTISTRWRITTASPHYTCRCAFGPPGNAPPPLYPLTSRHANHRLTTLQLMVRLWPAWMPTKRPVFSPPPPSHTQT